MDFAISLSSLADRIALAHAKFALSLKVRMRLYRQISVMLENEAKVKDILEELYNRASRNGTKPKEGLAVVIGEWLLTVRQGGKLSDAMVGWVPENEVMVVAAAEQSGNMPEVMQNLVEIVETRAAIQGSIIGKSAYPLALFGLTMVFLYIFGVKVIPQFTNVIPVDRWPRLAYSLYLMSQFVRNWGLPVLVLTLVIVAASLASMPVLTGRVRAKLDSIPPWSIYRMIIGANFMITLSTMLDSGVRIHDAITIIKNISSKYVSECLEGVIYGLNSGRDFGDALMQSGYEFPSREVAEDLGLYVRYSGDYAAAIKVIAKQWLKNGVKTIQERMEIIQTLSVIFMAVIIGWIVSGMFAIQMAISAMARNTGSAF